MLVADVLRNIQRMMCHDNFYEVRVDPAEELPDLIDLPIVDRAARSCERSRGVDARNREFPILEGGRQVVRDVFAIFRIGSEEAIHKVLERNVVISRHYDSRAIQGIEKLTGF